MSGQRRGVHAASRPLRSFPAPPVGPAPDPREQRRLRLADGVPNNVRRVVAWTTAHPGWSIDPSDPPWYRLLDPDGQRHGAGSVAARLPAQAAAQAVMIRWEWRVTGPETRARRAVRDRMGVAQKEAERYLRHPADRAVVRAVTVVSDPGTGRPGYRAAGRVYEGRMYGISGRLGARVRGNLVRWTPLAAAP